MPISVRRQKLGQHGRQAFVVVFPRNLAADNLFFCEVPLIMSFNDMATGEPPNRAPNSSFSSQSGRTVFNIQRTPVEQIGEALQRYNGSANALKQYVSGRRVDRSTMDSKIKTVRECEQHVKVKISMESKRIEGLGKSSSEVAKQRVQIAKLQKDFDRVRQNVQVRHCSEKNLIGIALHAARCITVYFFLICIHLYDINISFTHSLTYPSASALVFAGSAVKSTSDESRERVAFERARVQRRTNLNSDPSRCRGR